MGALDCILFLYKCPPPPPHHHPLLVLDGSPRLHSVPVQVPPPPPPHHHPLLVLDASPGLRAMSSKPKHSVLYKFGIPYLSLMRALDCILFLHKCRSHPHPLIRHSLLVLDASSGLRAVSGKPKRFVAAAHDQVVQGASFKGQGSQACPQLQLNEMV